MVSASSHQADVPTAALCTCDSSSDAKLALQPFSGTSNGLSCSALPSHRRLVVILYPAFMVHPGLLCEVSFLSVHENPFCFLLLFIINGATTPQAINKVNRQNSMKRSVLPVPQRYCTHLLLACVRPNPSLTQTGPDTCLLQDCISSHTKFTECCFSRLLCVPLELLLCVSLLRKISFLTMP